MRATYVLLAESREQGTAGLNLTNAGFNTFWVLATLPALLPDFCVIVGIEITPSDIDTLYEGELRFIDSDGNSLKAPDRPRMRWRDTPRLLPGISVDETHVRAMTIDLQHFTAHRYGTHRIEIWLNGAFSQSVNVFLQAEPKTGIPQHPEEEFTPLSE